jgi:hypothetical protein
MKSDRPPPEIFAARKHLVIDLTSRPRDWGKRVPNYPTYLRTRSAQYILTWKQGEKKKHCDRSTTTTTTSVTCPRECTRESPKVRSATNLHKVPELITPLPPPPSPPHHLQPQLKLKARTPAQQTQTMCLIRTRNDLDEEVNIPARVISQRAPHQQRSRRSVSRRRSRSRTESESESGSEAPSHSQSRTSRRDRPPPPRSLPPPSVVQEVDIYESRRASRPPSLSYGGGPGVVRSPRQSANVVTVQVDRSPRDSRGDQQIAVVRKSREYTGERDEGPSYRYVKPRRQSMRDREYEEDEDQGYGRSGRRSGSLTYAVNPRASTASRRSARERIVVQDHDGRRREYYK